MAELWDAYDRDFNIIENVTLTRGEPVPNGTYHLVCDVAVKHKDGEYLLMQRDERKHLGGMWELTAGGSALKGEAALECAKRELFEETGISGEFHEIGKSVHEGRNFIYVEWLCITDCEKDSVTLQEGETVAYKWVNADELKSMINNLASKRITEFLRELQV